jgi:hypothetical protein
MLLNGLDATSAAFEVGYESVNQFNREYSRPEAAPPDSYYPTVGQVIRSRAEGFSSRIIKTDQKYTWLELTFGPHAPDPRHIYTPPSRNTLWW